MKKPLPLALRFHNTPNGKILMVTCAETGRPLEGQTGVAMEFDVENMSYVVKSELVLEVEGLPSESEPLVGGETMTDPDEDWEDEDDDEEAQTPYGRRLGFKRPV